MSSVSGIPDSRGITDGDGVADSETEAVEDFDKVAVRVAELLGGVVIGDVALELAVFVIVIDELAVVLGVTLFVAVTDELAVADCDTVSATAVAKYSTRKIKRI